MSIKESIKSSEIQAANYSMLLHFSQVTFTTSFVRDDTAQQPSQPSKMRPHSHTEYSKAFETPE